ncbi:MAG TPA: serine/threonine-protein kinase [Kofleriaceae bacterium]|nr:serine/threonine-protein kinase [Kofleriaceae bacterium]
MYDLTTRLQVVRPGPRTEILSEGRRPTMPALVGEPDAPPRLGPYEVIGLLATGGMGGIYVARHALTQERVALKVLNAKMAAHDELVRRLFGELEVSRRVGHDGLVTIRDRAVSPDGTPYLVMELVDGENLADLLERGRIELGAIAAIGAQVSDALAAMHERRIVHCDLKPDNVIVMYQHGMAGWPRIKVVDFGVARFLDRVADPTVAGTPVYMPPEQWAGEVEPRTDVYALGCMLYELVTGVTPFVGSIVEVMAQHSECLPDAPTRRRPNVPAALEDLVLRMLAKEPGMRPRMADVSRVLTDLAFATPPGARVAELITLAS